MPISLTDQFISDLYPSILHIESETGLSGDGVELVYDGVGNTTTLGFRNGGLDVVVDNIVQPKSIELIEWIDFMYPVGSIILSIDNVNPGVRFIGSTWTNVGGGTVIAGVGNSGGVGYSPGANSGSYDISFKLTASNIPYVPHTHPLHPKENQWWDAEEAKAQGNLLYIAASTRSGDITHKADDGSGHSGDYSWKDQAAGHQWMAGENIDPETTVQSVSLPGANKSPALGVYIWQRTL